MVDGASGPRARVERLVAVGHRAPGLGSSDRWGISRANYLYYRDNVPGFEEVGAWRNAPTTLTGAGEAALVSGILATSDIMELLGARSVLGRVLVPSDNKPGAPMVVVLGHDLWSRKLGADSSIIGKTVLLGGTAWEVVGVMAPGIHMPNSSVDLWRPLRVDPSAAPVNSHVFPGIARLAPGYTVATVQADLDGRIAQFPELFPSAYSQAFMDRARFRADVTPLHRDVVGDASSVLWVLLGAVSLVLLIACANVANLLLARALGRRREIAVRLALGAGRRRLVQQLLVESVVLAGGGGILGFTLAYWLAALLLAFNPPFPVAISLDLGLDWRVVSFTGGAALLTGLVFGLIPALQATRPALVPALKDQESGARVGKMRLRNALLLPQVALSLVLLIVAGLFARSVQNASSVDLGFDAERSGIVTVDLGQQQGYDAERAELFWADLLERAKAMPGVQAATVSNWIPLGTLYSEQNLRVQTSDAAGTRTVERMAVGRVDEGYFGTLGITVRGRAFEKGDVERSASVAIVSEAAARRLWPDESPLGKRLRTRGEDGPEYEVVGVAADAKVRSLGEDPQPFLYVPIRNYGGMLHLIARAPSDPAAVVAALRRQITAIDDDMAVFQAATMEEHL